MRVAVLVKQIPTLDSLSLDREGRLIRDEGALEMNPFCRRALALGLELARDGTGHCTALTLAPDCGERILREALAAGADEGVLISDPVFAGSDTLATSRALASALNLLAPFDLILCGLQSVDADTGQVGPQVSELVGLPFVANACRVGFGTGDTLSITSVRDDGERTVRVNLPAVISVAERAIAPIKVDPSRLGLIPREAVRRLRAADLGTGPWGQAGSPTRVQAVYAIATERHRRILHGISPAQVREVVDHLLATRLAQNQAGPELVGEGGNPSVDKAFPERPVAALLEPGREVLSRELCAVAASFSQRFGAEMTAIGLTGTERWDLGAWGAHRLLIFDGAEVEEDVVPELVSWIRAHKPRLLVAPGTLWGREIASRACAALGFGLIGDAIGLSVSADAICAQKPALGGRQMADISSDSPTTVVTLRPGVAGAEIQVGYPVVGCRVETLRCVSRERVRVIDATRDADADKIGGAQAVLGVGMGVSLSDYPLLIPLIRALGAELVCTRKVADQGWLPRNRQVGLTGRHLSPSLYIAIGLRGNFNHMVGVSRAGMVLGINRDPHAPLFDDVDIGLVADWREAVPLVVRELMDREAGLPAHRAACGTANGLPARGKYREPV